MKKLAVHSLGWGIGAMVCIQLPVLANNPALGTASLASIIRQTSHQTLFAQSLGSRNLRQDDWRADAEDVRELQYRLREFELYYGPIDGVYGAATADAVSDFQRLYYLPATGNADEETLELMGFDFSRDVAPPSNVGRPDSRGFASLTSNSVGPGSSYQDISALQQRLKELGRFVAVDGVYGFETERAVRTFQRARGLQATGSADEETLRVMGFEVPDYPYVAAVIADDFQLADVQDYFSDAFLDRSRQGQFINIGSFAERSPAEARVDAAAARGFTARVLYH